MAQIVEVVKRTSDTESIDLFRTGVLIGVDMKGGTFRFTDPSLSVGSIAFILSAIQLSDIRLNSQ